jgi:hypothetical protein
MIVLATQTQLVSLEQTALNKIREVDLKTPMQQVAQVFEALLDVPTTARRANTAFSAQALAALQTLLAEMHRLCAVVDTMTEHVHRTPALAHANAAMPPRLHTTISEL